MYGHEGLWGGVCVSVCLCVCVGMSGLTSACVGVLDCVGVWVWSVWGHISKEIPLVWMQC